MSSQTGDSLSQQFFMGGSGFDGANQSSKRGKINWDAISSGDDLDQFSRAELYRNIRWLTENVGFCKNIVSGISTMIGHMMRFSATGEAEWDELVDEYLNERYEEAMTYDVSAQFDYFGSQEMLNRHRLTDGDHCTILSESKSGEGLLYFLESHQLANPAKPAGGKNRWREGVLLNPVGRAIAYNFKDLSGKDKIYPARDVVMFGEPQRTGHHRPIPPLAHAVTNAIDITEIRSDVKHAIKTAGLFGAIITGDTSLGGANEKAGAFSQLKKTGSGAGSGEEMSYEEVANGGGGIFRMKSGGSVDTIKDARPHQNQRDLMDDLIRDIYAGTGYPPEVLWHLGSNTGPAIRAMMARCKQKVTSDRRLLHKYNTRTSTYFIAKAIKAGKLPAPRGNFKWWKTMSMPQADPTIDRSRDKEEWNLVLAGGKTMQQYFAERGVFWKDAINDQVAIRRYFERSHPGEDFNTFFKFNASPTITPAPKS